MTKSVIINQMADAPKKVWFMKMPAMFFREEPARESDQSIAGASEEKILDFSNF